MLFSNQDSERYLGISKEFDKILLQSKPNSGEHLDHKLEENYRLYLFNCSESFYGNVERTILTCKKNLIYFLLNNSKDY